MYNILDNQIFGIDGLVNLSNIVFLAAISARDVLKLRILSFFSGSIILPYYYFQHETLWVPLLWSVAFMAVNAVRIVATALERRPVVLSEKEEQLYRIAFTSLEKKEFLKLVSLARWVDCSPGDVILEKGRPSTDATVLISGDVEAIFSNGTRMAFRPGQLIGDVGVYSGLASPVDVGARGYAVVVKWDSLQLVEFMASRPALRTKLQTLVSADLAAKLREITIAVSSLVMERSAPR
jgi:CRP-like cAMP-binding protein